MLAIRGRAARRIASAIVLAAGVVGITALPAHANLISGVCTFKVDISFPSTPPGLGVDFSPYKIEPVDNSSSCTFPGFGTTTLAQLHASAAAGFGGTTLSKCGVLAGDAGQWQESWVDGELMPPVGSGSHVLVGTWLHATIVATGDSTGKFQSVIQLLPDPSSPTENAMKMAQCAVPGGGAVSSIRMLAVQVINDPTL